MTERRVHMRNARRPWTPERRNENGGRTFTVKRACNGCGALLGDVTDAELLHAAGGWPVPDVRGECPYCSRSAS